MTTNFHDLKLFSVISTIKNKNLHFHVYHHKQIIENKKCRDRVFLPIHTELNLSVGAEIRIFVFFGEFACDLTSVKSLSPKPGKRVVPPERTICENKIRLKSKSVFIIEFTRISCTPKYVLVRC